MVSFAAYNSAFGIIEHDWSTVSKSLAGVVFDTCLPGEVKPPCNQTNISEEEKRVKEVQLFDETLRQLEGFYSGIKDIAGYPVAVHTIKCLEVSNRTKMFHLFHCSYLFD